jgi:hypothetical protein
VDHIPIGHLVLIFAVNLLLLEVMSLIAAYAVGRASDSHRGGHYVLAVCLPVIGPLARYTYLVRTGRATLAVVRSDHRSVPLVSGCAAFTLAAAVIATSTWLDWVQGSVTADFRSHWGFEGGRSPADLAVTAVATLGTAVLLVAAAALGAGLTMHGRIAVVCAACRPRLARGRPGRACAHVRRERCRVGRVERIRRPCRWRVVGRLGLDGSILPGSLAVLGAVAFLATPRRCHRCRTAQAGANAVTRPPATSTNSYSSDWW